MKVFCAGTFDVLTVGHFNLLMYCRTLAGHDGEVHISLDSDAKVKKDKGDDRPIFMWRDRVEAVSALDINQKKVVDKCHYHSSNEYLHELIKLLKPDVIVVGGDYREKNVIGSDVAEVKYFPRDWRFSSTNVIEACRTKNLNVI